MWPAPTYTYRMPSDRTRPRPADVAARWYSPACHIVSPASAPSSRRQPWRCVTVAPTSFTTPWTGWQVSSVARMRTPGVPRTRSWDLTCGRHGAGPGGIQPKEFQSVANAVRRLDHPFRCHHRERLYVDRHCDLCRATLLSAKWRLRTGVIYQRSFAKTRPSPVACFIYETLACVCS